jgi:hypothetical protein
MSKTNQGLKDIGGDDDFDRMSEDRTETVENPLLIHDEEENLLDQSRGVNDESLLMRRERDNFLEQFSKARED